MESTASKRARHHLAPHVLSNGRNVYEELERDLRLLALGVDGDDFGRAARARRVPLKVVQDMDPAARDKYGVAQWRAMAGVKATDVPYRGRAPTMLATINGEAQFSMLAAPQVKAGKLRALAIGSLKRDPQFPDLPIFSEAGFPGLEAVTWVGIFVPARTPPEIVQRLNGAIDKIIHEPDIAAKLNTQGIAVSGGTPDVLGRLVDDEIARWTAIARRNHIRAKR